MSLSQGLHQKLLQKLSPQQIQLMKLLQVPTAILEERIKEELEENPALETGEEGEEPETTDAEIEPIEDVHEKEPTEIESDYEEETDTFDDEPLDISDY